MKRRGIIAIISLLGIAIAPNIAIVSMAEDIASGGARALYILATVVLYAIGLCFLHKRAYFYTISLGFGFSLFEIYHLIARHRTISLLYCYTLLKTPPAEIWETIISPNGGYIMLAIGGVMLYYVIAHFYISRTYIAPLKWRLPIGIVLISVFILLPKWPCPMNSLQQFGKIVRIGLRVERHMPSQHTFTYGIAPKTTKAEETIIVVMGETDYEQWESIGYSDSLAIDFTSVYAECPASGVSIPLLLSRATPTELTPFFHEKSIIQAFDEADYYTAWLSNYGYHDHFLMREGDDCRYLSYLPQAPDTALLSAFHEVMSQPHIRHFVVLATQGGRQDDYKTQIPRLLHGLTDSLRTVHMPAMLVYVGATAIHLTNDSSGLHVPMMIWMNPNYRYRHRTELKQLYSCRTSTISTSSLFHTLLYLNGIETSYRDERKALGSPLFEAGDTIHYFDENMETKRLEIGE